MTWKWAGVDLFYGGAKAGISADPERRVKEAVLRAFVRALENEVPEEYVFGLDIGLTETDAAIMLDEVGGRGGAVGTPHALGGLPYDQLGVTGHGVAESADAAARQSRLSTSSLSVVDPGLRRGRRCRPPAARRTRGHRRGRVHLQRRHPQPRRPRRDQPLTLREQHGDGLVAHYSEAKPLRR